MTVANINIRIDGNLEAQAQQVFAECGLDLTAAINLFIRQSIRQHGIPFTVEASAPERKTPKLGCMKGKIWMADDFDAPREELVVN